MRYTNSELLNRLASEYVLGTLRGPARERFKRLLGQSIEARRAVQRWEQHLMPLNERVTAVEPRPETWHRIQQRTGALLDAKEPWYRRLGVWRSWSLLATAASVLLALALVLRSGTPAHEQYVAVFNNAESQPLWLVRADVDTGEFSVRAVNAKAPQGNHSFELWVLPAKGNPQSLGLLPVDNTKAMRLSHETASLLANAKGLAVSLEPAGGSPTGVPTGPVVNVTALVKI